MYVDHCRGQGTKVEIFDNGQEVEISILHGSLYRRQPVVKAGVFGMQSFWPVQSDVAVYHREFGELRVNAKSNKEKELYCRLLGKHLFGDESCFPTGVKYTLEPLREFGFDALTPGTVNRVKNVRLVELWLSDPDDCYGVTTKRQGDDLFRWAQARKKDIHIQRRLKAATVKMRLFGRKMRRGDHHSAAECSDVQPRASGRDHRRVVVAARIHHWRTTRTEISS